MRRKRFDATLVLGDLVGYGAGPNQVVDAIRDLPGEVHRIRGNHDKVVAGLEDGANFNHAALAAARWTTEHLTPANLRLVRELPRRSGRDRRRVRDLPRLAARRGPVRLLDVRRLGDLHALGGRPDLLRAHPRAVAVRGARTRDEGGAAARRERDDPDRGGHALPDQPGVDRAAARPRPARLLHDLRLETEAGALAARRVPGRTGAAAHRQGRPAAHAGRPAGARRVGSAGRSRQSRGIREIPLRSTGCRRDGDRPERSEGPRCRSVEGLGAVSRAAAAGGRAAGPDGRARRTPARRPRGSRRTRPRPDRSAASW